MKILNSTECASHAVRFKEMGKTIGFVPTMGALHEGHLSLAKKSIHDNDITVVSAYVNPTQFGPNEDFSAYPRDLEKDRALTESVPIDVLWVPTTDEIYPQGYSTYIEEKHFSSYLCGPFRPGHFRGVCTVVHRLLSILGPTRMYLGQKDAQQLRVLQKMVQDFQFPLDIVPCPTVREKDGLAMSSRNTYLTFEQREKAPALYASLCKAQQAFLAGERNVDTLISTVRNSLTPISTFRIQYIELRRWQDFEKEEEMTQPSLLAISAYLGKTRLLDNVLLHPL